MIFLLLNLLQPQQGRISRAVIVGAVLVFVAGVALLVYFYRRYKRIEKEPEEEWDLSRRSLFANVKPPEHETEEVRGQASAEVSAPVPKNASAQTGGTREFASETETLTTASQETAAPAPGIETAPQQPSQPKPHVEHSREQRVTEVLTSPSPKEPIAEAEPVRESLAFDEEVWAGLEAGEQPPISQEQFVERAPLQATAEPPRIARVDERSHREPFEPPRIEHIPRREPYEPPRIEPLTPREQAAVTRELRSPQPPQAQQNREPRARQTILFGSPSGLTEPLSSERAAREVAAQPSESMGEPSIAGGLAAKSHRAPAGSVLGLPAETSHQPLILGEPVLRAASETGIGSLSNYGKDLSEKGSRAGTIALLIVVVLLGGGLMLYFFVPSVHSRITAVIAHARGADTQAAIQAAMKPKAQIIQSTGQQVIKNTVTARGAVDNISDEALENLSIEVLLQRGGGAAPETLTVSVTPNPLPPGQRGTFEFEYNGKRDTGFTSYKITRLLSNGSEVKFRAPVQK